MKRRIIYLLSLLILLAGGVWFSRHSDGPPDLTSDYPSRKDTREGQGITNSVLRGAQPPAKNEDVKPDETNTPRPLAWNESSPDHVLKAIQHGATGKVTFHVCDSVGNPVRDSTVFVGFYLNDQRGNTVEGRTDENGYFTVEKLCSLDANCRITKNGYYRTNFRYYFHKAYTDCVRDGRWIPWNPTVEVVLKEKRKPIPMYAKLVEVILPEQDKPFGYDMMIGDLVKPYGTGKYGDVVLTYFFNFPKDASVESISRLIVASSTPNDGILSGSKDTWSDFNSVHEAPANGYATNLVLITRYLDRKLVEKKEVSQSNYLIVRNRTETDTEGKIIKANYGKIYGELIYGGTEKNLSGGMVRLHYYFNPAPNDRNLEFDGKNNLFNPKWNDSWNTNVP